jgi:hypothetical protein
MPTWRSLGPRTAAALAFGAAGMLLPAAWFAPVLLRAHDAASWALYVALPGAAGAAAGALLGRTLATPGGVGDGASAALRGAGVGALALLLFAPLFAAGVKWSEPGWTSVLGLTALVLELGALAVGWAVLVVGGAVGWLLYRGTRARARARA